MRKMWKSALCAFALFSMTAAVPVQAEDDYTYTVRIHAGNHGTIGGETTLEYDNLAPGSRFTFDKSSVQPDAGSKYYLKGIRESGKDNDTFVASTSFEVNEDVDLVVAYGMLSNATEYTIRYVDREGNELRDSVTYIGNVGDRPVVSYLYIEGYQPQAYNLTGTLKENNNVWDFVYSPVPEGTITTIPGTTTVIDETTTITAPATTPATTPATPPATTPAGEETTTPGEEGTTPEPGGEETTNPEGPAEIIDIDDPDTPLAGPEENEKGDASKSFLSMPALLGMGALALLLIGGIVYFVVRKNKEKS